MVKVKIDQKPVNLNQKPEVKLHNEALTKLIKRNTISKSNKWHFGSIFFSTSFTIFSTFLFVCLITGAIDQKWRDRFVEWALIKIHIETKENKRRKRGTTNLKEYHKLSILETIFKEPQERLKLSILLLNWY